MPTKRQPIAEILFTDGVSRAVYQDADGSQYVLDGREMVYGVWVKPDEPVLAGDDTRQGRQ